MHSPDVVVIPPEGFPEGNPAEDREAWFTQAMRLTDSWEEQRVEVEEMHDVTGDRVLSIFCWVTKGKDSGITWRRGWLPSRPCVTARSPGTSSPRPRGGPPGAGRA